MRDEWFEKRNPGAFQHESFGEKAGWFIAIQWACLLATLTEEIGFPTLFHSASVGGGLTQASAVGVLIGGVWLYGLMTLRRWAIVLLPYVCWLLLAIGLGVAAAGLLAPAPVLPGDTRAIGWFSIAASLLSAALAGIAIWRMRVPQFREYHRAAMGR